MIVTSVQIKTAKTQKHLYCPVFTKSNDNFREKIAVASLFFHFPVYYFACFLLCCPLFNIHPPAQLPAENPAA